jgi:hypothetical protein
LIAGCLQVRTEAEIDALLEQRLPKECGELGTRLFSLLSVLKVLQSLHRALKFIYIHCNHVEVRG